MQQPASQPAPANPQPAEESQAGSTMLAWQVARDPAWVQPAAQRHGAPPAAGESAPFFVPPSAVAALAIALRRATGLTIDSRDVTGAERAALEVASPPVTDPVMQGFLTWRRSVHLVAAIAILPLLLVQIIDLVGGRGRPAVLTALLVLQLLIDAGFAALLWYQLGSWTRWQKQQRILAAGWLAFFLTPFLLYLYPLRWAMEDPVATMLADPAVAQARGVALGVQASVLAMIQLAPAAVSLVSGVQRGAVIAKLLFPAASGPGWLMLLLAPLFALLLYLVLAVPYQISGSGYFVLAMIGLIGAEVWRSRAAYQLARPAGLEEALELVRKVRASCAALSSFGLLFAAFGLADLLRQLHISLWSGLAILLLLVVNILVVTLIAIDQIVSHLVRGQKLLAAHGAAEAQNLASDIAHFDDEADRPLGP
jgi:hypothetical protein